VWWQPRAMRHVGLAFTLPCHPLPRGGNARNWVFLPPRFDGYRGCVAADPRHFCPLYAAHPAAFAGDAYLDVTAPLLDRGSVTAIAQEIKLAIRTETDLTAPASVSKFPIKLALDHRKPDGLFVIRAPPGG
jgi:DNA polymerase IV